MNGYKSLKSLPMCVCLLINGIAKEVALTHGTDVSAGKAETHPLC